MSGLGGPGEISDMSFWAMEVPPGGSRCIYEIEQQPNSMQIVHVTNAALPGPKFSSGPHCLTIKKSGQGDTDFTLCTLNAEMHPQHSLDFIIDETVEFRNHGKGPVHLAGYETTTGPVGMSESDEEDETQPSSDAPVTSESEEEEEEEEAPKGVPLQANGPAAPQQKAKQAAQVVNNGMGPKQMSEDDDDESGGGLPELDSDDFVGECEDDEDYEGGELGSEEGSEEDEGESGEEEEEEKESDDEEGGEGESDEEDEGESEEDEGLQQQLQTQVGSKRSAPSPAAPTKGKQQQPMTPAPKKAKQELQKQAPNSAPAKQQQQPPQKQQQQSPGKAAPKNEQEYQSAIVNFLRSQPNKTAPLAKIGSAVPRPPGVQKLGPWTKSKPDLFKVDNNNQNLTLLK